MLRSLLGIIGSALARSGLVNAAILGPLRRIVDFADRERDSKRLGIGRGLPHRELLAKLSPDLRVQQGPFTGMQYPQLDSVGSALAAKLLGSYEFELHELVNELCARPYQRIVDIGCAEGYYAVGFAMRHPSVSVAAFDISDRATALCMQMAALNGVEDRVHVFGKCDEATLQQQLGVGRCLVFSDCEGYELELFSPKLVHSLGGTDLLIEIHDFINPTTSASLIERFQETHNLRRIRAVADRVRPRLFSSTCLADLSEASIFQLMAENRPAPMEWFFFESREH